MKLKLTTLALLFLVASVASAQIFQCKDPTTGKINFTDKPCDQANSSQVSGTPAASVQKNLNVSEKKKRIQEIDEAISRAKLHHNALKSMRGANKNENPAFDAMVNDSRWKAKAQEACLSEQTIARIEDLDRDRLMTCIYNHVENRANQLIELTNDKEIKHILSKGLYPSATPTNELTQKTTLLKSGKAGIDQALAQGLLKVATQEELKQWQKNAGRTSLPATVGSMDIYTIKAPIDLKGGLSGANSVVFLAPNSFLIPSGDRGHSAVLIIDNGTCLGVMCRLFK